MEKNVTVTLAVPASIVERFKRISELHSVNRSKFIRKVVIEALEKLEAQYGMKESKND